MSTDNLFIKEPAYNGYFVPLSLWQTGQRFLAMPASENSFGEDEFENCDFSLYTEACYLPMIRAFHNGSAGLELMDKWVDHFGWRNYRVPLMLLLPIQAANKLVIDLLSILDT